MVDGVERGMAVPTEKTVSVDRGVLVPMSVRDSDRQSAEWAALELRAAAYRCPSFTALLRELYPAAAGTASASNTVFGSKVTAAATATGTASKQSQAAATASATASSTSAAATAASAAAAADAFTSRVRTAARRLHRLHLAFGAHVRSDQQVVCGLALELLRRHGLGGKPAVAAAGTKAATTTTSTVVWGKYIPRSFRLDFCFID
jgi:hypothetical protein